MATKTTLNNDLKEFDNMPNQNKEAQKATISIAEFQNFVANKTWQQKEHHDILSRGAIGEDEEEICFVKGFAYKTSVSDNIKITYKENFAYEIDDAERVSASSRNQGEYEWEIEGIIILDEDGNEIAASDLGWILPLYLNSNNLNFLKRIDYESFLYYDCWSK